ncbi:Acyl-CoA-binding protein [Holothuria leucospilota]|uniref:Acyl-CoA-binding protein n=1 Tax=Holothuria leucospilota TaxID=206669 RepID=A0A9Q0YSZ3_HOLLE|nr:Acyl-CoA-binding protein [Holothuria leucospilota]
MPSDEFNKAAEDAKKLTVKPSDSDLLELYGLFKQVTVGDVNTERPGMFDMKGKAKWDAWNSRKGVSASEAEQLYIAKVKQLQGQ